MYKKHKKSGKTIFILINRSFLTRNILRSGTLELLKKAGHRIIIFFDAEKMPDYLRDEFEDDQVILYALRAGQRGRIHKRINIMKRYLIVTRNIKLNIRYYKDEKHETTLPSGIISRAEKSKVKIFFVLGIAHVLSRLPFLKSVFRWVEVALFPQHDKRIEGFFDTFNPDLIFSLSMGGTFEYVFFKEARRRKVTTLAMAKSWDNITNEYAPMIPDYFVAQNEITKTYAIKLQHMKEDNISLVGIPQFDWYRKEGVIVPREEYLLKKGFDPQKALIFFGSEGLWAINDYKIGEKIAQWIKDDEFIKPCQLLVRPHFSNVRSDVFNSLRSKKDVVVDDYRIVDFFIDKWDPSVEETIDFVNSVAHCDVMVSVASSLSLDAACLDRPAITIGFGGEYIEGKDVTTEKLYSTDHVHWLMSPGGVEKVDSYDELKTAINNYLRDPSINSEGRERMRERLCYKVDGKSSERLARAIEDILER